MATRNLSKRFITFRNSFRKPQKDSSGSQSYGGVAAPEWVDFVDQLRRDLDKSKEATRSLAKLHSARLKVSFGDDEVAQQERDIEIVTQEITRLLKLCENNLKRIALLQGDAVEDRKSRLNVMRAFGLELQNQSKNFRQMQKNFLKSLRDQQQLGESFGFTDAQGKGGAASAIADDEALDRGLSPEQQRHLQELAERSDSRYREIIKVAQNVSEISAMFRELNVLVIEQGTIIDRIDYNMEQTMNQVESGVKNLKEADNSSKKAYTMKCILILVVIFIILLIILIVMHTGSSSSSSSTSSSNSGNSGVTSSTGSSGSP